ncbi:GMC family oxidoreductase [Roseibium album]|uniref:GMC family oxidoreductase n=1 Tax=Roseibium album TaxID=311410 RepID=UPI002490603D|nr:GMC family oxidoreductase N-terminal domain-containing protein [Roseibium album]
MTAEHDFIVVGAGSAGCIAAAELVRREAGKVLLIEAGPPDNSPLVKMPFGLVWMIGNTRRDWCYSSAPQKHLGGRRLNVTRGRMVGGSGSINSMVWFRGRKDDFDTWQVPGWSWSDVAPAFEAVETRLTPGRMQGAHPLTEALHSLFPAYGTQPPTPEYESAGVFAFNMVDGRRRSAADGFIKPAPKGLTLQTSLEVDRILFTGDKASGVRLVDGSELQANKGVVLSAGSIGSPSILMRSGVGPKADLDRLGIDNRHDAEEVGENLHDHPAAGLHFTGSGYGLTASQIPGWALAPFQYLITRRGRFASPTVEGGAFFNARGLNEAPDVQTHFIPFMLGWQGKRYVYGSGYFADVGICRPKSRGALRLSDSDPGAAPEIDLGLFNDSSDLDTLVAGLKRLRNLMEQADFGRHRGREAFPGPSVQSQKALRAHVRERAATAYHPVGTLRMGAGSAPVDPRLSVRGVEGLWVADASVMPAVTSVNTNAPSMMIGYRAGEMISEDCV